MVRLGRILRLTIVAWLAASSVHAVPIQIPYSGQLSESGVPVTGARDLSIALYAAPTGGSPLYSETFSGVGIVNGVYHLRLNVPPTVWDGADRWLAVSVNGGSALDPRVKVGTVPYAIRSDQATNAIHADVADSLTSPSPTGSNWQVVFSGQTVVGAGAWVNVGPTLEVTTSGGPLLIIIDVYVNGGSHHTFQPLIDGVWAGSYSGMLNTGDPFWKEGLQLGGPSGYVQWNKAKIYRGIPAGTHSVRIQGATDSGTMSVGASSVPGSLSVIELKP